MMLKYISVFRKQKNELSFFTCKAEKEERKGKRELNNGTAQIVVLSPYYGRGFEWE